MRRSNWIFIYDNNGNLFSQVKMTFNPDTQAELETVTTAHSWDSQNRLIDTTITKSTAPASPTHNAFKYNAEGKRIQRINAAGAKTTYLYEGKDIVLELDVNGNQTAKNVRGLTLLKRNVTGKELIYFQNAHGDVTALLDKAGNLSGQYDYDAFGNLASEVEGAGNPYKYAGYEHDAETGLYNLKARYYNQLRKVTNRKGAFPSEMSLYKLLYLRIEEIKETWNRPVHNWPKVLNQLVILYDERITRHMRY